MGQLYILFALLCTKVPVLRVPERLSSQVCASTRCALLILEPRRRRQLRDVSFQIRISHSWTPAKLEHNLIATSSTSRYLLRPRSLIVYSDDSRVWPRADTL